MKARLIPAPTRRVIRPVIPPRTDVKVRAADTGEGRPGAPAGAVAASWEPFTALVEALTSHLAVAVPVRSSVLADGRLHYVFLEPEITACGLRMSSELHTRPHRIRSVWVWCAKCHASRHSTVGYDLREYEGDLTVYWHLRNARTVQRAYDGDPWQHVRPNRDRQDGSEPNSQR